MNWAAIHALVQEIPKTFRDPSFSNSGRQISRVVTASDPARELEQVKAWQTSLEGIVDELVGTHHGSPLDQELRRDRAAVRGEPRQRRHHARGPQRGQGASVSETNATAEKVRGRGADARQQEVARKLADLERLTRLPGTARACVAAGDFENAVALIERATRCMLRAPAARGYARAGARRRARRECAAPETFAHAAMAREIGHVVFCCDAPCRRDAANVGRSREIREIRATRRWKKTRRRWRRAD